MGHFRQNDPEKELKKSVTKERLELDNQCMALANLRHETLDFSKTLANLA